MKRFLKRTAFMMAMAMVISGTAPAAGSAYAAKNFTYAYQTGGAVSTLNMTAGESVDLRFIGVPDYANYSLKWKSSNPAVATVDKMGVVTAVANGTAVITLEVGDGSAYTSTGVAVHVGKTSEMTVVLGTSKDNTFSTYTMELGTTIDLNFYGVTDWSSSRYNTAWVSSDAAVATVDKMGVVTPVTEGKTTVTIAITNKESGVALKVIPVEITVTAPKEEVPEVNNTFSAVQTSDSIVTLTFANKELTKSELENGLSFYYYVGDIKIAYPIQVESVKDGVAVLSSYVTFTDGTKYGFEFAGETAEFTASIGEVASIQYSWHSEGDEYKAYAGTDTTITYKLLNAKGVDITATAMAQSGASVLFSLVKESENGDFWLSDSTNGKIYFNTENVVAQVEIEYITGKYDPVTYEPVPGPKTVASLISSKAPSYGIDVAAGGIGTIVKNASASGNSIDWNKASAVIALGDDMKNNYTLVVKLKDTRGNDVYTDSMDASKGTFSFSTTNNAILYVADDGTLMTNSTGTVNVLVYFTPTGSETGTVVAVIPVTVRPERTINSMTIDKASDVISTESGNGFNETTFTITLKDQLGDKIEGDIEISSNLKALPNGATAAPIVGAVEGEDGVYTVTVTGSAENLPTGATGYAYSFIAKAGNLSKTFSVTVKKPSFDKDGNLVITGYKIEFSGDDDLKTTDDSSKTATATLYLLSNGVKADIATLHKKLPSITSMTAGNYYYTVSKGGKTLDLASDNTTSIEIPLTAISAVDVNGISTNVVDKTKNGAGTYNVVIYKAIGNSTTSASASALSQVSSSTLTVKDSQDTLSYAGKSSNTFASMNGDIEELVKSCFKFKLGNTVLDDSSDYTNIRISVTANKLEDGGVLKPGSVCYVKSVDFYVETAVGSGTYVKYTATVNDYVEVK
ncbi:MAG: Ig domain-containing protein [Lachnospiraceae bacterium]